MGAQTVWSNVSYTHTGTASNLYTCTIILPCVQAMYVYEHA